MGGWWVGGACCFAVAAVFCLRYFKGIRALLVLRSIFLLFVLRIVFFTILIQSKDLGLTYFHSLYRHFYAFT